MSLDDLGDNFSDGIELLGRGLRASGMLVVFAVGGLTMLLFLIVTSPITLLGFIANRWGFKSRWRY